MRACHVQPLFDTACTAPNPVLGKGLVLGQSEMTARENGLFFSPFASCVCCLDMSSDFFSALKLQTRKYGM